MNDEFPRPYAEEPLPAEPLSGLRLLRARPAAIAATVLLNVVLTVAFVWAENHLIPESVLEDTIAGQVGSLLVELLPTIVPLVVIAWLSGRRVTVGRVLVLWFVAAVLAAANLVAVVSYWRSLDDFSGFETSRYVFLALWIVDSILAGLAGRLCLPSPGRPAVRGQDMLVLVLASIAVNLVMMIGLSAEGWLASDLVGGVLWGVLAVGWSVAALVTSRRRVSPWAGDPAELVRQDP
jgi:hypothetical protein